MAEFKGVIFDCDGVMFESRRANLAYYNDILTYFGADPVNENDREKADLCHAAASPEVLLHLLGEERRDAALEFAATIDYRKFIPCMDPEPGLHDALARLSESLPLAVATNRGSSMPAVLAHFELNRYFSTVVTSRDVERPKPHPDMLLLAISRLGLDNADVLFVGDSIYDKKAAEQAGIAFAAYKPSFEVPLSLESHAELTEYVLG